MKKPEISSIISACLLGIPCRYDGKAKLNKKALKVFLKGDCLAVCPEIMGGLKTPRPACEIYNGDGQKVLIGAAKVIDKKGKDYTKQFVSGAKKVTNLATKWGATKALLKSKSPSCGTNVIYSGKFNRKKKTGDGVLSALLKKNGIKVIEIK